MSLSIILDWFGENLMINNITLAREILSKVVVEVIHAEYYYCTKSWGFTNQINNFNKLYFIIKGHGYGKINNMEFHVYPGQLILIPSNSIHSFDSYENDNIQKYFCHFKSKTGDLELFDFFRVPYSVDIKNVTDLIKLFEKLISNFMSCNYMAVLKENTVMLQIIIYYLEHVEIEEIEISETKSTEILSIVINYINNNLSKNININVLAELVYLHPNYFIRYFKKYIGNSPKKYINKLRIEKAKKLLIVSKLSVTEISKEVGYTDSCYFSKYFKKITGFTPSEFRNK